MRWRPLLPWLLALGVALLLMAIQGRYVLEAASEGVSVYRLDRWTGEVVLILPGGSVRIPGPEETEAMAKRARTSDYGMATETRGLPHGQ